MIDISISLLRSNLLKIYVITVVAFICKSDHIENCQVGTNPDHRDYYLSTYYSDTDVSFLWLQTEN